MGSDSGMQSASKKRQRNEVASADAKVGDAGSVSGSESDSSSDSSSESSTDSESDNENEEEDVKPTESKTKTPTASVVPVVPAVKKLKKNAEGLNEEELEALKARKRAKTKAKGKALKLKQKAAGIVQPKKKRKQQPDTSEANTSGDGDEVAEKKLKNQPPVDAEEAAAIAKISAETAKEGFNALRLFIGQLPYKATVGQVKEHFNKHGAGDVTVRLLTDKKTSKSRGVAFVELSDSRQMVRALRVHHTRLDGKMINVERTCGGGGNNEKRKTKLKDLKELQGSRVGTEVKELAIEAVGAERAEKMDERVFEALTSFPREVAKHMVTEFADSDLTNVRNPSAWFMGLVKRYRMKLQDGEDLMGDGTGEVGSSNNRQSQSSYRGGAAKSRGGSAGGRGGRGGGAAGGRGGASSGRGGAQSNSWNSRGDSSNYNDSRSSSSSYSNNNSSERSYSGGNDYNNESNYTSYGGGEADADAVPKRTRGSKGRKKSKGGKALSEW